MQENEVKPPLLQLLHELATSPASYNREIAAIALGELGDRRAIDELIKALDNGSSDLIGEAALALAKIGDERAIEPLINVFRHEYGRYEADGWNNTAQALAQFGEKSLEALIQAFEDENKHVRAMSADALQRMRDPRAVPALIELMNSEDDSSVRDAINALGVIGDVSAFEPLLNKYRAEPEWASTIAAALGRLGDKRAVDTLMDLTRQPEKNLRSVTLLALSKIGAVEAFDLLLEDLNNQDWHIRKAAAQGLGLLGDKRAIPSLQKLLADIMEKQAKNRSLLRLAEEQTITKSLELLQDNDPQKRKQRLKEW